MVDQQSGGHSTRTTAAYTYNAMGDRVRAVVGTSVDGAAASVEDQRFLVDDLSPTGQPEVLEERSNGSLIASYILGERVIAQSAGGGKSLLLADGQGSTRIVTDLSGRITQRLDYDAWGRPLNFAPGQAGTNLLYDGQWLDPGLQQYYLRARFYDPSTGRFTTRDPFAGDPTNPATLARYPFAGNDPASNADPSGRNFFNSFIKPLGTAIHTAIYQQLYVPDHPYTVSLSNLGIPGTNLATGGFGAFADIVDLTLKQVAEIKSTSPAQIASGYVQLFSYLSLLNGLPTLYKSTTYTPAGPYLGGGWTPSNWAVGIRLAFPGLVNPRFFAVVAFTLGNYNGLVLYKYFYPKVNLQLVAEKAIEFALEAARRAADALGNAYQGVADALTVDTIGNILIHIIYGGLIVGAAYGLAALVAAVDWAQLGSDFATAIGLNSLAPVG